MRERNTAIISASFEKCHSKSMWTVICMKSYMYVVSHTDVITFIVVGILQKNSTILDLTVNLVMQRGDSGCG